MNESTQVAIYCTACCVVLIISSALLGVSFDTIEPTEYGLRFNRNTQYLESHKRYSSGRYLVGLGKEFIKFPRTYQTIKFGDGWDDADGRAIRARTSTGNTVDISVSFQYQLSNSPEDLSRLWRLFKKDWEKALSVIARWKIREVSAKYSAFDYFLNRSSIAEDMHVTLDNEVRPLFSRIRGFQLVNLEFNNQFADAIEETQVAVQDRKQALFEKDIAVIEADRDVRVAERIKEVTIEKSKLDAQATIALAEAEAAAIKVRVQKQTEAYQALRSKLGLNTSADVLSYSWLLALQENNARKMLIGLDLPSLLSNGIAST